MKELISPSLDVDVSLKVLEIAVIDFSTSSILKFSS